jgi:hypothetical protein
MIRFTQSDIDEINYLLEQRQKFVKKHALDNRYEMYDEFKSDINV